MTYTTRVELHRAVDADYTKLHAAMATQGFSRTITDQAGKSYHLPTAEYNLSSLLARDKVLEKAQAAAATTGKASSILVTESNGRTWADLPAA